MDHVLSSLNTLYKHKGRKILLCGDGNLVRLLPAGRSCLTADRSIEGPSCGLVALGAPATASSSGLKWNLGALAFPLYQPCPMCCPLRMLSGRANQAKRECRHEDKASANGCLAGATECIKNTSQTSCKRHPEFSAITCSTETCMETLRSLWGLMLFLTETTRQNGNRSSLLNKLACLGRCESVHD